MMKWQDGIQVECDWFINKTFKYNCWVRESILSKSTKKEKKKLLMKRKIKRKTRTRFKRLGFFQVLYTLLYSRRTFGWVEFILSWTIWVLSFFVISSCIKSVSNKSDIFVVFIHVEWSILDSKQSIQLFRKYKLHSTNSIPLKKSNKLLKHSLSLSFMILLHSPFFQIKSYFPTPFHFIMPCSHSPYKTTTNFLQITAFFQKKNISSILFILFFTRLSIKYHLRCPQKYSG